MRNLLTVGLVLAPLCSPLAQQQPPATGTLIPAPTMPAPNPGAAAGPAWFGAIASAIEHVLPWVGQQALQAEIRRTMARDVEPKLNALRPTLGESILVLEVVVAQPAWHPSAYHRRLVGISWRGVGSAPLEAILMGSVRIGDEVQPHTPMVNGRAVSLDGLASGVPEGYSISLSDSAFLIVRADEPSLRFLSPLETNSIRARALEYLSERALLDEIVRREEVERWRQLEVQAMTTIPRLRGEEIAQQLFRSARVASERMAEIDRQLSEALERQRRAAAARRWLDTVGQMLSLASQIAEVSSLLGRDAPAAPLTIENTDHLRQRITEAQQRIDDLARTLEEQQRRTRTEMRDLNRTIRERLPDWGIPDLALPPRLP